MNILMFTKYHPQYISDKYSPVVALSVIVAGVYTSRMIQNILFQLKHLGEVRQWEKQV